MNKLYWPKPTFEVLFYIYIYIYIYIYYIFLEFKKKKGTWWI